MNSENSEVKNRTLANARERKRMKCINVGFDHLRKQLPGRYHDKRLSKVETLKSAIEYINTLSNLLQNHPPPNTPNTSPNFFAYQSTIWTPPQNLNK
ncbi:unnamed protein product [Caenorhabditis angaria]|uniref:BHLH domain-containing protein n=1 Tax=Caenorhabditis angaria TaxID=860376 RepID=A0A9P1MZI5_9PELO|nr:unnamed protein product [Caenorhabditis angaria]